MPFTSLGALVATAAALPVPGIKKTAAFRPRRVNAADLPLMYTRLPTSERVSETLTFAQGLRQASLEIVVLVEMLNLDTQATNDALTVQLMDNLALTIEANADVLGLVNYSLTTDEDTIGDGAAPVQAIIATVEVSG